MSATKLLPGDPVQWDHPVKVKGKEDRIIHLRGIIADHLNLKTRGEKQLYPVVRPRNRKTVMVQADNDMKPFKLKTRWMERSKLRKLPTS